MFILKKNKINVEKEKLIKHVCIEYIFKSYK